MPSARSLPPTTTVGSRPASRSTVPSSEVVVVLPCVPATAMPYFMRISSASISARGITGIFSSRARTTSGFENVTADEMTTTSTRSSTCAASCTPVKMRRAEPLEPARGLALGDVGAGHACSPSVSSTSAMPLMPMPPIPTKWTRRFGPFTAVTPCSALSGHPVHPTCPATMRSNYRSGWPSSSRPALRCTSMQTRATCAAASRTAERRERGRHRRAGVPGSASSGASAAASRRAVEVAIEDQPRRPGADEDLGVAPLVVVGGVGIGHQDRRQAHAR